MSLPILNNEIVPDRKQHPERVVQIGAGNFLRAFIDWIVQNLNEQAEFDAGVVIVKVTPEARFDALDILDTQDNMYHVLLQGVRNGEPVSEIKRVTSIQRTVHAYEAFDDYLALATQPEVRFIISNTTEAGIVYVAQDKLTDTPPSSFPAKMTVFLHHRYQHFKGAADKGCILLPTELISNNGDQLKAYVLQYAEQWGLEAGFVNWLNEHNVFCNTLVDRIVPGFPAEQAESVYAELGVRDGLLVSGEPYHSWVIEGPESLHDELPFKQTDLNVKIVPDALPYRDTKVRILNGPHTSIAMLGPLMGLEIVRDCVEDDLMGAFLNDLIYKEIIPVTDLPQDELTAFAGNVFDRFRNPHIDHKLLSIALNTGSKIKARILPTLLDYYAKNGTLPTRLMLVIAAYIRFYKGKWKGEALPISDEEGIVEAFKSHWSNGDTLAKVAASALADETIFGQDLTQIDGFTAQIAAYLERIESDGVPAILKDING